MTRAVVLIGSGPSLNRIDVRQLFGFDAIAFNRSWLAWSEWGFAPRYYACLDPASMALVGPELPPVIAAYPATRFFLQRNATKAGIEASGGVTLCDLAKGARFSDTVSSLTDFGNVGAVSMQILCTLGYRRILLVGVDGEYLLENNADKDANHFREDYAPDRALLTPALRARYTSHWPTVAGECLRLGIEVVNASPGTTLTCFERGAVDDGLAWLRGA